jgi:hypothetical protein
MQIHTIIHYFLTYLIIHFKLFIRSTHICIFVTVDTVSDALLKICEYLLAGNFQQCFSETMN